MTSSIARAVVQAKLARMSELLADLDMVGEVDGERLRRDRMLCHAVERILTQLVETAADINAHAATRLGRSVPADYRTSFAAAAAVGLIPEGLAVRLAPSAGLRNLLVHEYAEVDLGLVAAAVDIARRDYAAYVRAVARFLADLST